MDKNVPKIIFEDDYIAVLNKPAGVVVNRADTVKGAKTLQDFVEGNIRLNRKDLDEYEEFRSRSGIVHRLDKETSGIILVAKDNMSFNALKNQFKESRVEKTYIALAHGKIPTPEGEINVPVGRLPYDRKKFGIVPGGREARTFFKVLDYKTLAAGKEKEILTLLELYPKTGRTHQIRVHLRYLGFPIFSDSLYAGRKNIKLDRKLLSRHFLHAMKIKFNHPKTDQIFEFESPLPSDLVDFLARLN